MATQPGPSDAVRFRHMFVRDLVLAASIGVHPFEHDAPQRIRINLDLFVEDDGARLPAGNSVGRDVLSRVVDYEKVADTVRSIVLAGHVRLVETLAERIAEACLADARVSVARVRVEKLDILPDATSVGVEIERCRANLSTP
jgi:dihydroneopterin aldolase